MGNNRKKKKISPKSREESQAYRQSILHSPYSPDATDDRSINIDLQGSDELYIDDHENSTNLKSVPVPKTVKFREWLSKTVLIF